MVIMRKVNLRSVDLNLFVVLQKILETRHITKAAEQLNMSQPAVSRALNRLRSTFDDSVLVKTEHGYDLSARMITVYPQLKSTLDNIQNILCEAAFDPYTSEETIRFYSPDVEMIAFLTAFYQCLRQEAPNMALSIKNDPRDHFDLLLSGDVHFSMTAKKPNLSQDNFKFIRLSESEHVCVVGVKSKLSDINLTINDYLNVPHGVISISEHGNEMSPVDKRLAQLNKKRYVAITLPSFLSIPCFCECSDTIFTIPKIIAVQLAKNNKIVIKSLPLELQLKNLEFRLYWHHRYDLDPMCTWIRNRLVSLFSLVLT